MAGQVTPPPSSVLRRRDVLRLSLAAAGLGLTGCAANDSAAGRRRAAIGDFWRHQHKTDQLSFANWPIYIDPSHATLTEFTASTGISVHYSDPISDLEAFFAQIEPSLQAGKPTGYDLMVLTNGFEFSELQALDQLIPLDQRLMRNFYARAAPRFRHRSYDPGNVYSVPWASGMTGVAWNPRYVKDPVTSINALWDPAYKGRVGMMVDVSDTGNFGMLKLGINPETSTPDDWRRAAGALLAQREAGLVRNYYAQDYIGALASGETWISMAWSGDIFQVNQQSGTNLRFAIPDEGGTIWTDNMLIPRHAANPLGAMMLMDWYYRPEIAAMLTTGIGYITAVPAVRDIIARHAHSATGRAKQTLTTLATSPLVWPTPSEYRRLYHYANISGQLKVEYQSIFQPIVAM